MMRFRKPRGPRGDRSGCGTVFLDVLERIFDLVEDSAEHLDAEVVEIGLVDVETVDGIAHA